MNDWIDPDMCRPNKNTTVEAYLDGGQFAGKWAQELEYRDGHFYYMDIILDKEVYAWRYKECDID